MHYAEMTDTDILKQDACLNVHTLRSCSKRAVVYYYRISNKIKIVDMP